MVEQNAIGQDAVLVVTVRMPRAAWETGAFDEVLVTNSVPLSPEAAPPELVLADAPAMKKLQEKTEKTDAKTDARLKLPRMGLAQTFSREDLARFRARQVTEVHLTFLRGVF